MADFKKILVATDLMPNSTAAVRMAVRLARENGAQLIIAHAYAPPDRIQADSIARGIYEEWERNMQAEIAKGLSPLVEDARKQGVDARSVILPGAPYEAIANAAREHGVDLIVTGTHGRTGVSRFFLGSVASRVISTAPCPVMTVRGA